MTDISRSIARPSPLAPSSERLISFAILAMIGMGLLAWDYLSAGRHSPLLIGLLPGAQLLLLAGLALVKKVPLRVTIGAYMGGLLVIATVYYTVWYQSLHYNGGGANIGLGIIALAAILLLPIPMLIGGLIGWLVPPGKKIVLSETKAATSSDEMI